MPTAAATLCKISEITFSAAPQVDADAGVIRGVKVCGKVSKNGREYSEQALKDAARMYEGIGVNLDHPSGKSAAERSVQDGFGWLENVDLKSDGLYGDLHFFKTDPFAAKLCEAATRRPDRFGLSHVVEGQTSRNKATGKVVVESIVSVHSVDVVQNPATVSGLFESQETPHMPKTVKEILSGCERGPAVVKLLSEMEGEGGGMDAVPVDVPPEMSAEDQVSAAFKAMVVAVLDDGSLDLAGKKKKIGDILAAQEKLTAAPEAPADAPAGDAPAADAPTEESVRKAREAAATELLEAAGIKSDAAKVKALAALTDAAERKALIESWKPAEKPVQKPRYSAGRFSEGTDGGYESVKKQIETERLFG